jgi:hypothetical protein
MTIYIYGYGSLINTKYIKEIDIKRKRNIFPIQLNNHYRHWIYTPSKKIYVGLYKFFNKKTNGILIEVNQSELELLDKREKYYIRKEINKNDIIQKYQSININSFDIIYTYYTDESKCVKWIFDFESLQCKNYLYNILGGCIKISRQFFEDFLFTTKGWKNNL